MKILDVVAKTSLTHITLWWLMSFMIEISFLICAPIFCFCIFSLSKILIATASFVSLLNAYFTFPKLPSPNVLYNSYFPTVLTILMDYTVTTRKLVSMLSLTSPTSHRRQISSEDEPFFSQAVIDHAFGLVKSVQSCVVGAIYRKGKTSCLPSIWSDLHQLHNYHFIFFIYASKTSQKQSWFDAKSVGKTESG